MNDKLKARLENFRYFEKDDFFEGQAMNSVSKNTATEMLVLINDLEKALIEAENNLNYNIEADYWSERCKLVEAAEKESPCDPDITSDQINAWSNYHNFIKVKGQRNYR